MRSNQETFGPLVSTNWLCENIDNEDLAIIDASWHMPNSGRIGSEEYQNCHIKRAQFFDIDLISDTSSNFPHMMPSEAIFNKHVGAMGISNSHRIVVYDSIGIFSSPRVWWMFRHMGHDKVAVLDGGLKKWIGEGKSISNVASNPISCEYKAAKQHYLVKSFDEVMENVATKEAQIIDARGPARFFGEVPEPRAGLKSGHIAGSVNLPFANLINPDGTLIDDEALKTELEKICIDMNSQVITTCGSGVTACILALAFAKLGKTQVPIYDGSWAEWGATEGALIE
jgi:thiosulfate/3-mercaptopyruvate sulfurtransferase